MGRLEDIIARHERDEEAGPGLVAERHRPLAIFLLVGGIVAIVAIILLAS